MIGDFNHIPKLPAIFGPATQVAYVVPDIDAAVLIGDRKQETDHGYN